MSMFGMSSVYNYNYSTIIGKRHRFSPCNAVRWRPRRKRRNDGDSNRHRSHCGRTECRTAERHRHECDRRHAIGVAQSDQAVAQETLASVRGSVTGLAAEAVAAGRCGGARRERPPGHCWCCADQRRRRVTARRRCADGVLLSVIEPVIKTRPIIWPTKRRS